MGLHKVPELRYDDVPDENVPLEKKINLRKALMLVDRIQTAAFEFYIPDEIIIDQTMDATVYSEGRTFAELVRTDIPPPSNDRIARATSRPDLGPGVRPVLSDRDFMVWLSLVFKWYWTGLSARRAAPPLIFSGRGDRRKWGAKPFLGIIMKFDRTPADGRTVDDMVASVGVMVPPGQKADVKPDHRVIVDATPEPIDSQSTLVNEEPEKTRREK